jgi:hypothetical protein
MDDKKYKIWGYPAKTEPLWNYRGHFVGSTDNIDDAHALKKNVQLLGWGTVLIIESNSLIVE